jgi:hypothetical protein
MSEEMSTQKQSNGMALASLILGILSIVLCFTGWIGIIAGILAIIFAVIGKKNIAKNPALASTKGMATGGMITGIIGLAISLIFIILALMFVSAVAGAIGDAEGWKELENSLKDLENMKMLF